MRTAKFRGWSPDLKRWIYGAYINHCNCAVCFTEDDRPEYHEAKIIFEKMMDWGFPYRTMVADVIVESVGECAGRLPGSIEAFEGDIVQNKDTCEIGAIKHGIYDRVHEGFYIEWQSGLLQSLKFWENRIAVIGNMFENPELAEKFEEADKHGEAEE